MPCNVKAVGSPQLFCFLIEYKGSILFVEVPLHKEGYSPYHSETSHSAAHPTFDVEPILNH